MLISTETQSYRKVGDNRKIIKLLKDSGFTAYDFSMFGGSLGGEILYADDYKEKAKEFRRYADKIGIPCNQTHAPFATAQKGNDAYNKEMFQKIVKAIEVSGILGAKICVIHPCNDYTLEENAILYKSFESYAREAGVKIGVENIWDWPNGSPTAIQGACSHHENFRAHLDLLPADIFVACLDIGHAELKGLGTSAVQMIETLNERLEAIHLHDIDLTHDNHALPFTYNIDYEPIIKALKKVGYKGDITLESNMFIKKSPLELLSASTRYSASVADYFKMRIE